MLGDSALKGANPEQSRAALGLPPQFPASGPALGAWALPTGRSHTALKGE